MKRTRTNTSLDDDTMDETNNEFEEVEEHSENSEVGEPETKRPNLKKASSEKRKNKDFYKPPTREELNVLKENETLFQSSLFRLQIDELLSAVRVGEKVKTLFSKWFNDFKTFITNLPEFPTHDIQDLTWLKKSKIIVPFGSNPIPVKGTFKFAPPKDVNVVGGFPLGISVKSGLTIDVFCRMPKECFQHDDYLNYRYHFKRALYLCVLAKKLRKNEMVESLFFNYLYGETLKPVLLIKPQGKLGKHAMIRILIGPSPNVFKSSRFVPERNNIRWKCLFPEDTHSDVPTPLYNASILADIRLESESEYLEEALCSHQGIRDGIILLKIWLHQRQLDQGFGSVSGYVISSLVLYLLQNKKINPLMSCYQIVRITWLSLSNMNWTAEGISLMKTSDKQLSCLETFHNHFSVVFMDSTGCLNICANMEDATFLRLRHEATLALKFLDSGDSFEPLFMTTMPFLQKFDHVIRISPDIEMLQLVQQCNIKDKFFHMGGNLEATIANFLLLLLRESLNKRVELIDIQRIQCSSWPISDSAPNSPAAFSFGLLLDQENSTRVLDIGPPADFPEAKKFREFWGTKSELRRFADGNICEAVLWHGESMSERRLICSQVAQYALKKHAGISKESIMYIGGQLDSLLAVPFLSWPSDLLPYGTGEEIMTNISISLDRFRKELQSLSGFDYSIVSVQGIAPSFRYSEVFPPIPTLQNPTDKTVERKQHYLIPRAGSKQAPNWFPALTVLIQLGGGDKWPDDLKTIMRKKALVYLQLDSLLSTQCQLKCVTYPKHLDVYKDGLVFRLKVSYMKEIKLLKMEKTKDGQLIPKTAEGFTDLENDLVHMPKFTSILHGIQMQHNIFSSTCRLAKRWISSQLLMDLVSELAIELIVVHLFLSPSPYTLPRSPQVGFQRFLAFLSQFDWQNMPLIINFNEELKKEEIAEIHTKFSSMRSTLPAMFIATPFDKFSSSWTSNNPSVQILHHLKLLAKAALEALESQLPENNLNFKQIFRPSFKSYDVIIHLKPKQIPTRHLAVDLHVKTKIFDYIKYEHRADEVMPVVDYDPVKCYMKELREAYGHFAIFLNDPFGGNVVAVLWKPNAFKPQPFKVSQVNGHKFEMSSTKEPIMVPNIEAILQDFGIIGTGLVHTIDTKTEKWVID